MNEVSYKLQTTRCCPPQGRELLQKKIINYHIPLSCCPPQGRELLLCERGGIWTNVNVAVPRRGASCYVNAIQVTLHSKPRCCCPPQGRELLPHYFRKSLT